MSKKTSLKQFLMRTGKFAKVYDSILAIRNGQIKINDKTISNPNHFFNPKKALVKFESEKLKPIKKLYFILNKPSGYICQKSKDEKNIYDLIEKLNVPKKIALSLFAIGRLDKETEGLMIITNDGNLSNIIMNPKNEIIKKYYAVLEKLIGVNKIKQLEKGIEISIDKEKYRTKPCRIKIVGEKELYISISEGKKRQIRKMFDAIGNKIVYLKRISIAGLQLGNLKIGELKQVAREELYNSLGFQGKVNLCVLTFFG